MNKCPVCRGLVDALMYDLAPNDLESGLISRLNEAWKPADGICVRCVYAVNTSARNIREKQSRPMRAEGFREYTRFHLSRVESGKWNHCNSDIARYHQRRIIERVERDAAIGRCKSWVLMDCEEKIVAQGVDNSAT